ncbi:hypothetical protein FOCC_FOCC004750 [Frankliniella occidentalis]|uniref:Uncharacterized protein LOC113212282 n=1 Tax=Frankliniella occidentalis TaxID=133901 RepID=A0A6J1T0G5_FRAOC|nr:uncharacterized protein LOC113212282 [Frankliniella occidentalis]KAE8748574.1 hypothetical protein FOCC_FOCC004750 [Frankliniella occidentalis]
MATKTVVLFAAVVLACLSVAVAGPQNRQLNACSSRTLGYLKQQIQICCRSVPSQQYFNPGFVCGNEVTSSLERDSSCSLQRAPEVLGRCLQRHYLQGDAATACLKKALDNGVCC